MCGCRFSFNAVAPEWSDQGLSRETACPVPGMLNLARDATYWFKVQPGFNPNLSCAPEIPRIGAAGFVATSYLAKKVPGQTQPFFTSLNEHANCIGIWLILSVEGSSQ